MRKNKGVLFDSFFQVGQHNKKSFHSVATIQQSSDDLAANGPLSTIQIRRDMQYSFYVRQIVDILGVLGAVGGLRGFCVMIGAYLVNYWASKQFMGSIIHKIFQTRNYKEIQGAGNGK